MRSGPHAAIVAVPNVTPMIDVMLVLLIIFMVVTPALTSGVHAEPPVAENVAPRPTDEGDHTLALDAAGKLYLDTKPVAAALLGPSLRALYPAGAADRVLFVRAHKELPYAAVVDAVDVASRNGVAVVGFVSERRRDLP